MWHRKATSSSLRCSFRHKPKDQVEQLLAGPRGIYICTSCVACCAQLVVAGDSLHHTAPAPATISIRLPTSG